MSSRTSHALTALVLLLAGTSSPQLFAQGSGSTADLQKKLNDEFALTKMTDDRSDIVTAGAVVVLHKDTLLMYSTSAVTPPLNTYSNGRISQSATGNYLRSLGGILHKGGEAAALNGTPQRKFVSGEKFWVTAIDVQPEGVLFTVYSDPFNNVRYYGQLKFPYPKNSLPPADEVVKTVEEAMTVQQGDDAEAKGGRNQGAAHAQNGPAAPSTPPPAMAPIPPPPPPPPPDQAAPPPKTISIGQTKDVVVAAWGPPTKDIKLSNKEILVYPDMKVTLVAGKVSDVQ